MYQYSKDVVDRDTKYVNLPHFDQLSTIPTIPYSLLCIPRTNEMNVPMKEENTT